ncbi:E3 ubiquitin-protein ligase TRIM47-like [Sardina pilchardus]|uniref:E3 ubiquitin-protein ligase TRIM47-like n=1 Tax=Sardina pilchardus TaxID=27697 RepID=UPI002E0E58F6
MTEAISQEEESFTCPVCLDLLKDPVTIPCGHNFCMRCIKSCWDEEDQKGVYSCPLCKHTFTTRPALYKNPLIAEMVEHFRKTRIQAAPHNYAGPGDVECDVCTGRKLKAVKSCLECLVSYCETHYKVHNEVKTGRKHSVVDATGQLEERICSRHKKVLETFCRTDQHCICFLCMMDDHKGHDTVAERTHKQEIGIKSVDIEQQMQLGQTQTRFQEREKELQELRKAVETIKGSTYPGVPHTVHTLGMPPIPHDTNHRRFQPRIQEREKKLRELSKAVETLKSSAQTAVEDTERIFTEMIRSIERRRSEVKQLIRAQMKAEVSRAVGLLKQMEQEIAEHREDNIHSIKNFPSIRESPHSKDLPSMTFNRSLSFQAVKESVSAVKVQLDGIFKQEAAKISAAGWTNI